MKTGLEAGLAAKAKSLAETLAGGGAWAAPNSSKRGILAQAPFFCYFQFIPELFEALDALKPPRRTNVQFLTLDSATCPPMRISVSITRVVSANQHKSAQIDLAAHHLDEQE